ncbi:MAG TPA: glycogen debranching N-terminal domain-containing protein [Ilumatobacteraceae bacterium]|nr:glycogen debranching N-terminal domain-containing protein [Ilumatobacteraceae bacterium]
MSPHAAQPSPWVLATEPTSLGDPSGLVTLVDGQTFCLCGRSGDFSTNPTHGVFFADMRVLSQARLLVGGSPVESLAVSLADASGATFVGRSIPASQTETRVLVVRRRQLGSVWHEQIELRNTGIAPVSTVVEFEVAADFADMFAIKEGRPSIEGAHSLEIRDHSLLFGWRLDDVHRQAELSVDGPPVQVSRRGFVWDVNIEPHAACVLQLDLTVALGDSWIERRHHHPNLPNAANRNQGWLSSVPKLRTSDRNLSAAYDRSVEDIGALRLHDPTGRRRPVIAAGAPWYMTLFGRDALISAYMTLPIDPTLAIGVLEALGELQGRVVDPHTEEEPGRIMHETRYLGVDEPTLTGGSTYYGSADATPLYVLLLGELSRWGLGEEAVRGLLPFADRALAWMEEYGDRDGDGYIEYQKTSDRGLANQGWKDSADGIRYRSGVVAEAPLALCEVQAYAYAAYRAREEIANRLGQPDVAKRHKMLAELLMERFNRDFWLEEHGWYAVALGPDKRPVDSLTSNIGHCLWTGIVPPERARLVADRLMSPQMWNGWGIRTLAMDEEAYDPMSYHCGTVWPHDCALAAAGLRRYGFEADALTVARGLLAAAEAWNGRLPELFCGLDRADVETPVPFPTSCSPQAWSAATPFLLLRIMLGLEPDEEKGITVEPIPGAIEDDLLLAGLRLVDRRFNIRIDDGVATVRELGDRAAPPVDGGIAIDVTPPRPEAGSGAEPPPHRVRRSPLSAARQMLERRRRH